MYLRAVSCDLVDRISFQQPVRALARRSQGALAPEEPNVYRPQREDELALQRSAMFLTMNMRQARFRSSGAGRMF